ncbi:protein Wnt-16-like [Acanthaster planci]|uniref:Protein Wnt n=1 Tax=Acanthaster planci TaxID=133434 RepID=A0A8B7ZL29_ACAPL|nr:protein Wnt-16-like [Acanthaster planci]
MDAKKLPYWEFSCLILLCFLPAISKASWMWLGIASLGTVNQPSDTNPPASSSPGLARTQPTTLGQSVCSLVPGLAHEQRTVCEQRPEAIPVIGAGARLGITECQRQFRDERWNCTIHDQEQNAFGKVLKTGSRETAFVYAITSAGVVHAVTKTCSLGNLTDCSCDESRNGMVNAEGWQWGGCSDNLDYGIHIGRQFVDAGEVRRDEEEGKSSRVRGAMNLHNNEVGRQMIQQLMSRQCRCHGVSGSCTVKSCWNTMPDFLVVGDHLKKRYQRSVEILNRPSKRRLRRKDRAQRKAPIGRDEMVHLERSPNYCVRDPSKGIMGTLGRECNRTSDGASSCDLLCCGRGYNTQEVRLVERCDCRFIWCCEVKCRICETVTDLYTCK